MELQWVMVEEDIFYGEGKKRNSIFLEKEGHKISATDCFGFTFLKL